MPTIKNSCGTKIHSGDHGLLCLQATDAFFKLTCTKIEEEPCFYKPAFVCLVGCLIDCILASQVLICIVCQGNRFVKAKMLSQTLRGNEALSKAKTQPKRMRDPSKMMRDTSKKGQKCGKMMRDTAL